MNKEKGGFYLQIDKLRGEQLDQLFDAILSLKTREECYEFFDDVATMNETQSLSQRLQVAKMLNEGSTYNAIEKQTESFNRNYFPCTTMFGLWKWRIRNCFKTNKQMIMCREPLTLKRRKWFFLSQKIKDYLS